MNEYELNDILDIIEDSLPRVANGLYQRSDFVSNDGATTVKIYRVGKNLRIDVIRNNNEQTTA